MEFPEFDLPLAEGGRLRRDDLLGRPWFVYMARHPGCFVCQAKLADVLARREEIQGLGADVLVTFQAAEDSCRTWARKSKANGDIPADLRIVVDPEAELYDAVGTIRRTRGFDLAQTLRGMWESRGHLRKWRVSSNDMFRMGADVALDAEACIAFRHICDSPEDRADPRDVIAAIQRTPAAVR